MKAIHTIPYKIYTLPHLLKQLACWRVGNKTVAFTNGCFDILHEGHIFSLSQAAKEADYLVVGINSDASVQALKGLERPINKENSRTLLLSHLAIIDAVIIFNEATPLELIKAIMPDVIVKGGDYKVDQIAGSKEVLANGGRVIINPIVEGFSTSGIIHQIKTSFS